MIRKVIKGRLGETRAPWVLALLGVMIFSAPYKVCAGQAANSHQDEYNKRDHRYKQDPGSPLQMSLQSHKPQQTQASQPPAQNSLPPALREKAIRYSHMQYVLYFGGVSLELAIYAALWLCGFGEWLCRLAARASTRLFVRCLIFIPIFWMLASVIAFPLDFYGGYVVERRFGLSTQGFASWMGDWGKMLALSAVAAIIVAWILYRVIRASPRRWWLWFWIITLPLALFVMFGEPYVVEPLFYKYVPLAQTEPALTGRIEAMLHRAGVRIPPSRIFEMNASSKTRALNAYVSGLGASKRVVVWDTTLKEMTQDETLVMLAHEVGHYVLHHGVKEFALDEIIALVVFFVGFWVVTGSVRRWGAQTGIEDVGDLSSFPLLMLVLTLAIFLLSPAYCAVSRHYEHQADKYGLELSYDVVPNPNAAMVRSFEILGKDDLADPSPSPFIKFWLFTHPPLAERIRFAETYHPWTERKPMKLLGKG
ncbi:MAG TPA: M48 family metallopeptidase [Terriglobia bacterium]|nr:M48 family metallopeptidase [Terriglobia bacterium]